MTVALHADASVASTEAGSFDPLGDLVSGVRRQLGVDVLLESVDGGVLSYALSRLPVQPFMDAVLERSSTALHAGLRDSRASRVGSGGPVVNGTLDGKHVSVLTVVNDQRALGRLWLGGELSSDGHAWLVQQLRDIACVMTTLSLIDPQLDVLAVLREEAPVPSEFVGTDLYVLALTTGQTSPAVCADAFRQAGSSGRGAAVLRVASDAMAAFALLGSPQWMRFAQVRQEVESWCAAAGLTPPLRAGIAVVGHEGIARARHQAVCALGAGHVGCQSLADVRSELVVRQLFEALEGLDYLGPDPVSALVRDHKDFARSLLAWLDQHGDTAAAARMLVVHPNTLRYRIRRAQELLEKPLHDPVFRLEVHLRLRAHLLGEGGSDLKE